jgi:hypothetical protein
MMWKPIHFIEEPVEAIFDQPPSLEKIPGCPQSFIWRDSTYEIVELISEWHDYRRRGRMARNMRPEHTLTAEKRGSWGVGQDYFRVRIANGQVFDLYFDRAPVDIDHRKGGWFLYRELLQEEG